MESSLRSFLLCAVASLWIIASSVANLHSEDCGFVQIVEFLIMKISCNILKLLQCVQNTHQVFLHNVWTCK